MGAEWEPPAAELVLLPRGLCSTGLGLLRGTLVWITDFLRYNGPPVNNNNFLYRAKCIFPFRLYIFNLQIGFLIILRSKYYLRRILGSKGW